MFSLRIRRAASAATALVLACLSANGQEVLPFPLDPVADAGPGGALELRPVPRRLLELASRSSAVFEGVPLPGGRSARLELERVDLPIIRNLHVDGAPAELLASDLTLWRGRVTGSPHSSVMLGLSRYGSRGWIRDGHDVVHLVAAADETGDWSLSRAEMWTETALNELGMTLDGFCTELMPGGDETREVPVHVIDDPVQTIGVGTPPQLVCRIAFETDFQLYEVFGSLIAEQVYMQTLLGAIGDRYREQIQTRIEASYLAFYTTPADPWVTNDNDPDASSGAILGEFRNAWAGAPFPGDAHLAHLISGEGSGGVAYLGVLCNNDWGFGVSGSINGGVGFPVTQAPINWDFMVIAHEIGHNYGTSHTHNYCPPIDECAPVGYWGSCQDEVGCIGDGTLMSYCHTCSGGTGNITTYFHPQVVNVMRAGAEGACLPFDTESGPFCNASDGSLASCPCGQGDPDSGCEIAQSTGGVKLDVVQQQTAPANSALFSGTGFPPAEFPTVVVIRSDGMESSPVAFGDGLRCIGTPIVRLGGGIALGGTSGHVFGHGEAVGSGTFFYQLWFRNTPAMFCTSDGFNLSNGQRLTW